MSEAPHAAQATDADALASFVDKWRARWPEWTLAEIFVPPGQREVALAWAALQQELTDAAWGGSDPRPGEAKLAWWQDELRGWSQARRRHPLGSALQRLPAPWEALAASLPDLGASRDRPRDEAGAFAQLWPAAMAAAAIERALFARVEQQPIEQQPAGQPPADATVRLIASGWLLVRTACNDASVVPLSLLARAGGNSGLSSWREALLRQWPDPRSATRPRRLWSAISRARGVQGDIARPLSLWSTLWTAWRAARNGSLQDS